MVPFHAAFIQNAKNGCVDVGGRSPEFCDGQWDGRMDVADAGGGADRSVDVPWAPDMVKQTPNHGLQKSV